MQLTLMVLAAGMGSRYGGLKQLDPVGPGGEILLDYAVYDALRAGFDRLLFLIRKDFETEFRDKVLPRFEGRIQADIAFQDTTSLPCSYQSPAGREKPWGTCHAVWCAKDQLPGPFAVLNADDYYGVGAFSVLAAALRAGSAAAGPSVARYCMVGFLLDRTLSEHGAVSRGICSSSNGMLESIEEVTGIRRGPDGISGVGEDGNARFLKGDETVSMNCWGFQPSIFPLLEKELLEFLQAHGEELKSESYLPTAVQSMVKSGKAAIDVLSSPDPWFGMTFQEDREEVRTRLLQLVQSGVYPAKLTSFPTR